MPHSTRQDISRTDSLAIESLVLVTALDDYCAINLHVIIEATALEICKQWRLLPVNFRVYGVTNAHRPRYGADLAAERTADAGESVESLLGVDHNDAIIDVNTNEKAGTSCMHHY